MAMGGNDRPKTTVRDELNPTLGMSMREAEVHLLDLCIFHDGAMRYNIEIQAFFVRLYIPTLTVDPIYLFSQRQRPDLPIQTQAQSKVTSSSHPLWLLPSNTRPHTIYALITYPSAAHQEYFPSTKPLNNDNHEDRRTLYTLRRPCGRSPQFLRHRRDRQRSSRLQSWSR